METSDSECFESAGEEFYSDDERDEHDKKASKKDCKKNDLEEKNAKNEKCVFNKDDDKNKNMEVKNSKIETSQHPLEIKKNWDEKSFDDFESKKLPEKIKTNPEIVQCWEEGVQTKKIITKDNEKNSESASKLSESSKTQDDNMWDNDDWDIEENLPESSEVDSKLMKIQSAHPETVKNQSHSKVQNVKEIPEQVISSNEKDESVKNIERKLLETKISTQSNENQEENMWDNDWGEEENDAPKNDTIKDDASKDDLKNRKKEQEENLWEDNWDDFDEPISKPISKPLSKPSENAEDFNSWEDDWEPIENIPKTTSSNTPLNAQEENKKDTGWGAWGNWGLSSVISTATNLTSHVSQSITTVLETGIGAPNPEELAKSDREIEKVVENVSDDDNPEDDKPIRFGLGSIVQGVTKLVETTSSKVITGGLDTLETIGKKTMEVLQENDPGLKKKRAFLALSDDKPILSQMLREAKEKSEQENLEVGKKEIKRPNYETLFDDYQGLVHLEALEMLSKQCDIKLSCLIDASDGESLIDMQETLEQIKELCELPEDDEEEIFDKDDIKEKIETSVKELNVPICYDKLLSVWDDAESWLDGIDTENVEVNSRDVHQRAVETLAELTAIAVEQFHKGGELLLVKQHRSTADEADSLVQLTVTITSLIGIVSSKFSEKLNRIIRNEEDKTEVNDLITNVFYEAANSTTYIKDAFQLLVPVLQVGAV